MQSIYLVPFSGIQLESVFCGATSLHNALGKRGRYRSEKVCFDESFAEENNGAMKSENAILAGISIFGAALRIVQQQQLVQHGVLIQSGR